MVGRYAIALIVAKPISSQLYGMLKVGFMTLIPSNLPVGDRGLAFPIRTSSPIL